MARTRRHNAALKGLRILNERKATKRARSRAEALPAPDKPDETAPEQGHDKGDRT